MTQPLLKRYTGTPFNAGTEVYPVDSFTGDGVVSLFDLEFLNGLQVGSAAQVETTIKPRHTEALTVIDDTVQLDSIPGNGDGVIIPGSSAIVFPASDQDDALGRTQTIPLYIADVETIQFYKYKLVPGQTGIRLRFQNLLASGSGAQSSWFTLAPADPVTGLAGSYVSTLNMEDLDGESELDGPVSGMDGTITVLDGSVFTEGDFLMIDQGEAEQEVLRISTISGDVLTVPGLVGDDHSDGATVITCGRKFWAKVIVPLNAGSGIPFNFYNVTLETFVRATSRA